MKKNCIECGKEFKPWRLTGKYCSNKCKGIGKSGMNHPHYKEISSYGSLHQWIQYNYGKASFCENYYCQKRCEKYEWSRIKGSDLTKTRENFWQLCKVCHLVYDKPDLIVSKNPI